MTYSALRYKKPGLSKAAYAGYEEDRERAANPSATTSMIQRKCADCEENAPMQSIDGGSGVGTKMIPKSKAKACREVLRKTMKVKPRAIRFLDRASFDILFALRNMHSADNKESLRVQGIVKRWFGKSNISTMLKVSEGLDKISKVLKPMSVKRGDITCHQNGSAEAIKLGVCGEGVSANGTDHPAPHVFMCTNVFPNPEPILMQLFMHEGAHAAGFDKDYAYLDDRLYEFVTPERRLRMPDSYVGLAVELNKTLRGETRDRVEDFESIDKTDNCTDEQGRVAKHAVALVQRILTDSFTSLGELRDHQKPRFQSAHLEAIRSLHPKFPNGLTKAKRDALIDKLLLRLAELSLPVNNVLSIKCSGAGNPTMPLGGKWHQTAGMPNTNLTLTDQFFQTAQDIDKGALVLMQLLVNASSKIARSDKKKIVLMMQKFNETQNTNEWRRD